MDTEKVFECPECDTALESEMKECPKCNAAIAFCTRRAHYVLASDFKDSVGMCEGCWEKTVDQ